MRIRQAHRAPWPSFRRPFSLALATWLSVAVAGCAASAGAVPHTERLTREDASQQLALLEKGGLVLGEFPIGGAASVVDGDTIRVKGLASSLRLLCIDTEETFKHAKEREAYAAGWVAYEKAMRGDSTRPVKMASPLGEDAKDFAKKFFDGVQSVRLERDHPGEVRDFYGRYLAYVFAKKNGKWVNYNLEAVRAGMSPYFNKYGNSRRFHQEFLDAQVEARAKKLGIWDPTKEHYSDYDERLEWWNSRAETIRQFEQRAEESPEEYIPLTRWDAFLKLEQRVGQKAAVMGAVSRIYEARRGPVVVKLSRSRGNDFDVVFFDRDIFHATGLASSKGEVIQVQGVVSKYLDKRRQRERLQIVVSLPGQVLYRGAPASPEPPPLPVGEGGADDEDPD